MRCMGCWNQYLQERFSDRVGESVPWTSGSRTKYVNRGWPTACGQDGVVGRPV